MSVTEASNPWLGFILLNYYVMLIPFYYLLFSSSYTIVHCSRENNSLIMMLATNWQNMLNWYGISRYVVFYEEGNWKWNVLRPGYFYPEQWISFQLLDTGMVIRFPVELIVLSFLSIWCLKLCICHKCPWAGCSVVEVSANTYQFNVLYDIFKACSS